MIETTDEKYNELWKDLNITLTFLKNQINNKTDDSCTRLENLVNAVAYILDSLRWHGDIPNLESEESTAQIRNEPGQGLKILTPNQMLSRLPISSAQLKAGNNSEKLKNEIRQLLYSLYRSKRLTKQLYKSLICIFKDGNNFYKKRNSKTSESHRFRLNLMDKLELKDPKKHGFSQFEYLLHLEKHQVRIQ